MNNVYGEVPERSKGADCKSVGSAFEGSNPSLPSKKVLKLSFSTFFFGVFMPEKDLDGVCFSCTQCSHCCRHEPGYVYLSQKDLTKLCHWFNLDSKVFIKNFCRFVPFYDGSEVLCLREKINYDCIFWDNGCTVYDARPVQCRTYPFWNSIIQDRESWNREAEHCPGINHGRSYTTAEINERNTEYKTNVPIKKTEIGD
jgi:uncharacterized protein